MQLRIDYDGMNELRGIILDFYEKNGNRAVSIFQEEVESSLGKMAIYYLLDKKHVLQYSVGLDDKGWGTTTSMIMLGIGPHYFSPAAFWSYENFRRFKITAEPFDIRINLRLMDEFLSSRGDG